jgi:hypothetical protein
VRLRQEARDVPLVLVDLRHGNRVPLVEAREDRRPVLDLEPLGVRDAGGKPPRDVHGDVVPADRDGVRVNDLAAPEHPDAGGAAAEVDHDRAHLRLVVHERREAGGIGGGDHRLDVEVAALHREHEVARRGGLRGDDVKVDAELVADHPERVGDRAGPVQGITHGKGVKRGPVRTEGARARGAEHAGDVVRPDGAAPDRRVRRRSAGMPGGRRSG